ncbi:hypothetical protein ACOSP7_016818 [Xanthoceras sorbifolium]
MHALWGCSSLRSVRCSFGLVQGVPRVNGLSFFYFILLESTVGRPRRGNQPPMCAGERGERASWGRGAVQRKEKSGGRRGGAVGAAGGFTKMKCCSRAPKEKMQV